MANDASQTKDRKMNLENYWNVRAHRMATRYDDLPEKSSLMFAALICSSVGIIENGNRSIQGILNDC